MPRGQFGAVSGTHACRGAALLVGLALAASPAVAQVSVAEAACGSLATHYGPFDYRTDRDRLPVVEKRHFLPSVEMLNRRIEKNLSGQLDYTLNAFPNHHRALLTLVRYGQQEHSLQPQRLPWSIDCYFDRALRFRQDDPVVRMIFARHLRLTGRRDLAVEQLDVTRSLSGDNPLTHYNLGLAYFESDEFDKAVEQAHRAMELGYTHPGLKDLLSAKGRWIDAPNDAGKAASSPES